jgi:hypothetical protein
MKIYGFFHVACLGEWRSIVNEQLDRLDASGLAAATTHLQGFVLGDDWEPRLEEAGTFFSHPDLHIYEFPTLALLWEQARSGEAFYAYYLHTKGASRPGVQSVVDWRLQLEHFTIDRWQEAMQKLDEGYDCVGCDSGSFEQWPQNPFHYSGNFWWTTSSWVRQLPPIPDLNWQHPFEAEAWIGWHDPWPKAYTSFFAQRSHYYDRIAPEEYLGKGYQ